MSARTHGFSRFRHDHERSLGEDRREPGQRIEQVQRDMEPVGPHTDGLGLVSAEHAGREPAGVNRRGKWSASGCAHDAKGSTGGSVSAGPDTSYAVERSDAGEVWSGGYGGTVRT